MTDNDKMREVPPITDETYKSLMAALGMPNNRSLLSALQQIANHATQRASWQAAQSVPVVGEPVGSLFIQNNGFISCVSQGIETGKNAGGRWIQVIEKPATSITETELERLRKDAERYRKALVSIAEYWNADRNDEAMHDACWYAINTASDALGD